MQCPACQIENPKGVKFCGECGSRLERICPQCHAANPPQFKFCGECGQALSGPLETPPPKSLPEKRPAPSPLPKELTEKILGQKGRIEGERRQVTVMFCDLEGSTALTERLGDEKAFSFIDEIFGILTEQVHRHEGTVQEFRGDGIMALFGAPIAMENAAQRAVNAALAIHQEVTKFSHRIQEETRGPAIRMRIGIHTGPVVLGTIGSDLRLEFQVIGDTVNLAARVESLAEPGTTYVTEETFQQTEGFFRFEGMGERQVKGKETPIKVYRVLAPSSLRTRFDVSAEQGLTPLVGRRRELEFLLDGFERAKAGKGQAFTLISEAGLGKSRLLYEFRKAVSYEEITFLEGRCISYGRGLAYHPIIAILRSFFNIQEGEDDLRVKSKMQKGLEILGVEVNATLPFLLEFLSVQDSGLAPLQMSPEAKREKMIEVLKRIILKGSEIRPLVIALEDLHWLDKSSEEALKTILASLPGSRVLAIFTGRPEFVPPWSGKTYHSQLMLQRLSNRESLEMASSLLGAGGMEKSLEELLLEKTEGIPFFLEEFLKSLRDLKLIESHGSVFGLSRDVLEMSVPTTIQEVILARVDSLPPEAKEVLQTGSVIEREFDFQVLKQVLRFLEPELLSYLSLLKDSELLYERGLAPESTYIFRHALTREVVYDSILTDRRKELHEAVGLALEMLHRERVDDYYGLLSEHFIKSENYGKGAEYSRKAARKAEKAASLDNAIDYAGKRISCLEKLPQNNELEKKRIDARTTLGLYLVQMNCHVGAKEAVDPIIDLAIRSNYKRRLGQINLILGSYYNFVEEDQAMAIGILEEALKIAAQTQDPITYVLGGYWLGWTFACNCEFEKSLNYFQRVIDFNMTANNNWGTAAIKGTLAYIYSWLWGRCDLGFQTSSEAIQLAEESGDTYSQGLAYSGHGFSCFGKGYLDEAEKYLSKSLDFCGRIRHESWVAAVSFGLGDLYWEGKNFIKSKENFERAIRGCEEGRNMPSAANLARIGVARSKVMEGERGFNLEPLLNYPLKNRWMSFEGYYRKWIGDLLRQMDGDYLSAAESWINKAIDADIRNGTNLNLARDYLSYADLLTKKGDRQKAVENLGKAIETFKECGADGWVEKAERKLAEIA